MNPIVLIGIAFVAVLAGYGFVKSRKTSTVTADGMSVEATQAALTRRGASGSMVERAMRGRRIKMAATIERNLVTANFPIRPHEFIAGNLIFLVIILIIDAIIVGRMVSSPGLFGMLKVAFVVLFMPWFGLKFPQMILQFIANQRRNKLEIQLAEALTLVSSGLKGGYSFIQGMSMAAEQLEPPITDEIARVIRLIQLGLDTPRALDQLAQRVNSYDYDMTVSATNIQLSSGGNLSILLEKIAETIRDRIRLRRDIAALTAQGRISGAILIGLPIGIGLMLNVINGEYFSLLYTTTLGHNLITFAFLLQSVGVYWIQKLLNFDN